MEQRAAPRTALQAIVLLAMALLAGGCANRGSLASRFAPDRARAIVLHAERGDAQAVHTLVDLLEDDDQAVRLYAILALQRLTGETHGYRYYEAETERAKAVMAWRQALRDGTVRVRGAPVAGDDSRGSHAGKRENADRSATLGDAQPPVARDVGDVRPRRGP